MTALNLYLTASNLPLPVEEYAFHLTRKWRFDLAWPDMRIAVEIEGGAWTQGRHTRGKGYIADMEKYNEAALLGWLVLRFTPEQMENDYALNYIREAILQRRRHESH